MAAKKKPNARPARPPAPAEAAEQEAADDGPQIVVTVTSDNVLIRGEHPVSYSEISDRETMEVRRRTGQTLAAVIRDVIYEPDIDVVKILVWLSLRQGGMPTLDWDRVRLTYDDTYEIDLDPAGRTVPKA